jgi:hypothetical protein
MHNTAQHSTAAGLRLCTCIVYVVPEQSHSTACWSARCQQARLDFCGLLIIPVVTLSLARRLSAQVPQGSTIENLHISIVC